MDARAAAHLQDNQRPVNTSDGTVLEAWLQSVVAGRSSRLHPRHVPAQLCGSSKPRALGSARAGCEDWQVDPQGTQPLKRVWQPTNKLCALALPHPTKPAAACWKALSQQLPAAGLMLLLLPASGMPGPLGGLFPAAQLGQGMPKLGREPSVCLYFC